jgi:uncharacterized repeat protein (TIGR01451 family)
MLSGTLFVASVQAAPPQQDPRPPVDTGNGGGGNGGGGGGGGGVGGINGNGNGNGNGGSFSAQCATLSGQVINWGVGGMGGVGTELKTGSWQASTLSAADGNYGFGGLGVGAATLHVTIAPELADDLQPSIQDAAVYLNCEFPIVANIAVFSDLPAEPPATIEMTASSPTIEAGGEVDFTLTVDNDLPNEISNAVVTVLIPVGLEPVNVTAPVAPEAIFMADTDQAEKLVVVYLGEVDSRATAKIEVSVAADADVAAPELTSTAWLFYRESVADQASLELTVDDIGGAGLVPAPISETPDAPASAETPATDSRALPTADTASAEIESPTTASAEDATSEEEEGEGFVPPNGLPGTGGDLPEPADLPEEVDLLQRTADRAPARVNFAPPAELVSTSDQAVIRSQERLAATGLNPLLPLAGLALAGFVFVVHQLFEARRNKE